MLHVWQLPVVAAPSALTELEDGRAVGEATVLLKTFPIDSLSFCRFSYLALSPEEPAHRACKTFGQFIFKKKEAARADMRGFLCRSRELTRKH